jgi:hypothetical protein
VQAAAADALSGRINTDVLLFLLFSWGPYARRPNPRFASARDASALGAHPRREGWQWCPSHCGGGNVMSAGSLCVPGAGTSIELCSSGSTSMRERRSWAMPSGMRWLHHGAAQCSVCPGYGLKLPHSWRSM